MATSLELDDRFESTMKHVVVASGSSVVLLVRVEVGVAAFVLDSPFVLFDALQAALLPLRFWPVVAGASQSPDLPRGEHPSWRCLAV